MSLRIVLPVFGKDGYANYFNALESFGAEGIPADTIEKADPAEFDGLLLPGGVDVDPACYGEQMAGAETTNPALDALQLGALDRFFKAEKPVFGICRGHQVINVYFGGTLIQHLPSSHIHAHNRETNADRVHLSHATGEWLTNLYGTHFATNSSHHQASDRIGNGLTVDMMSDDGVVEAAHHESGLVHSVQWHPERMCLKHQRADTVNGEPVLRWFLKHCV